GQGEGDRTEVSLNDRDPLTRRPSAADLSPTGRGGVCLAAPLPIRTALGQPDKMTKLLEDAIKKVRELPESDQDEAAETLFSLAAKRREPVRLDDETRAVIREGR